MTNPWSKDWGVLYRNDTTNGQRVSRHSLPTLLCFNFFPTAQNILNCHRTNGTFGFALPTSRPFSKTKRAVFCQRTDYNCKLETRNN